MKHSVWVCTLLAVGVVHADKPKPPHGAKHIALDYTWQSFSSDEWHAKLEWNGSTYTVDKRTVDPKLIDALYASLTNLKDEPEPLRCISHTDDYPAFKIAVDGDEPITITSESNCHAYVPWNITIGGKAHVQFTGDVYRALKPILAAAADRWKKGGNSPEATMAYGGEMVGLGEYEAGKPPTGDAGKCAHSLEINPQARLVLGDIKVKELRLGCNLSESADCSAGMIEATFAWQGLDIQLELPCTGGQVSMPTAQVSALTELQGFVTSKPVRALVKLSSDTPRLWNNRDTWSIDGGGVEGAPVLAWAPKTKVIDARTFGETIPVAYWKELGLDIKPLLRKNNGFYEVDVNLDFTGKRVK